MLDRTAIFIDGANLYATAKALNFDVDFRLLLKYFSEQFSVVRTLYYTAVLPDNDEPNSIRPLLDWLEYNGYTMVTKPTKQWTNDAGYTKVKGNMDVEIAVDAMLLASRLDRAIFFTGDGDFKALLLALQRQGVHCSVISTIASNPPMCADELRRAADTFVDLSVLQPMIGRAERVIPVEKGRSKYA